MAEDLAGSLSDRAARALRDATARAASEGCEEVSRAHLFLALLDDPQTDLFVATNHYDVEVAPLRAALEAEVAAAPRTGEARPRMSKDLASWMRDARALGGSRYKWSRLRSGALLAAVVAAPRQHASPAVAAALKDFPPRDVASDLTYVVAGCAEDRAEAPMPMIGPPPRRSSSQVPTYAIAALALALIRVLLHLLKH